MAVIRSIARRELRSYFATPLAYVFIVIFLALTGLFTFDDASADVDAVMMSIEDARQENIIRQQGREEAEERG